MKKSLILFFVLICAALSVMAVSAAPRDRYYDQMGNKHWCNSDSYGCWVTGENGEHEYIMFWFESARDAIMGPDSKAPIGTNPGTSELPLLPPTPAASGSGKVNPPSSKCQYADETDCKDQCSNSGVCDGTVCGSGQVCIIKATWNGGSSDDCCSCERQCQ